MYRVGTKIYHGKRKICRVWDRHLKLIGNEWKVDNNEVIQNLVPHMNTVFNLMGKDAFEILKIHNKVENELKVIEEKIELIQASPSSMNINVQINLNLNLNDLPFTFLILPKINSSPKNISDLIDYKHNLETIRARCSFYIYAIRNLKESLEVFNDEERVRILGALFQFRDDKLPFTHDIMGNPFFKQAAEDWGFIGKEADFYFRDDRVSVFRDDIGEKLKLVKIDDKHTLYFNDFDEYLMYYIDIFKKEIKDLMIY